MEWFHVDIPQEALDDLHRRLAATRWPAEIPGCGWSRGVPLAYLKDLAEYWRTSFDWRSAERRLNSFPQFTTEIDGTSIHFLHVRSKHPGAVPLILTHGWPGSFVEFVEIIDSLTGPADPRDAFHVVVPSIPGFGFSGRPAEPGWHLARTARAWAELMRRLGYDRYAVQGGDFGALISLDLCRTEPAHVLGAHVNFLITRPHPEPGELGESDRDRLRDAVRFDTDPPAYIRVQATRPQTISYGLTDSPVGLLAWIVEKFQEWTDSAELPEEAVDRDQLLTNVSLYWLTASGASSAQLYFEVAAQFRHAPAAEPPWRAPVGVAVFPRDFVRPVRSLAERAIPTITHWTEFDRGGHFAAMEQPRLFVEDVRAFFRSCR
ncbi:epoxide hydrolase family protein [Amycolatopsis kentuckyensis]|uniref:epoxide hydrolase family protein n=1 Tax=Amycolatopsis kentuckyensis TaxID=218823 RepID=UPI003562EA2B